MVTGMVGTMPHIPIHAPHVPAITPGRLELVPLKQPFRFVTEHMVNTMGHVLKVLFKEFAILATDSCFMHAKSHIAFWPVLELLYSL